MPQTMPGNSGIADAEAVLPFQGVSYRALLFKFHIYLGEPMFRIENFIRFVPPQDNYQLPPKLSKRTLLSGAVPFLFPIP